MDFIIALAKAIHIINVVMVIGFGVHFIYKIYHPKTRATKRVEGSNNVSSILSGGFCLDGTCLTIIIV